METYMNGANRKISFIYTNYHDKNSYKLSGLCVLGQRQGAFDYIYILQQFSKGGIANPILQTGKLISQRLSGMPETTLFLCSTARIQTLYPTSRSMHT